MHNSQLRANLMARSPTYAKFVPKLQAPIFWDSKLVPQVQTSSDKSKVFVSIEDIVDIPSPRSTNQRHEWNPEPVCRKDNNNWIGLGLLPQIPP